MTSKLDIYHKIHETVKVLPVQAAISLALVEVIGLYPYGYGAGDEESARLDDSCAVHYDINLPMFDQRLSPAYVSDFTDFFLIQVYWEFRERVMFAS